MNYLAKIKVVRNRHMVLARDISQGRGFEHKDFKRACWLLAKLFPNEPAEVVVRFLLPSFAEMDLMGAESTALNNIKLMQHDERDWRAVSDV